LKYTNPLLRHDENERNVDVLHNYSRDTCVKL